MDVSPSRHRRGIVRPPEARGRCRAGASGGVIVAAVAAISLAGAGSAAPRKPHHAMPETAHDVDIGTTGTIPAKPPKSVSPTPPPAVTAKDDDETLPPPFRLPPAPRKRMRDCGRKWQAMKTSGEVGEQIWRDFAAGCLAAASGPFDQRSDR